MKKFILIMVVFISFFSFMIRSDADDTDLFLITDVYPDAFILLDISWSMSCYPSGHYIYAKKIQGGWPPFYYYYCPHEGPYYPFPTSDYPDSCSLEKLRYSNITCSGPFYLSPVEGYTTNCSMLNISKKAIFNLLDDNHDGIINVEDEKSFKIRVGSKIFCFRCDNPRKEIGSSYSDIWLEIGNTGYSESLTTLFDELKFTKDYFNAHKINDPAKDCRKKVIILFSDGKDSYHCMVYPPGAMEGDTDPQHYRSRGDIVKMSKEIRDAGYKLFIVGLETPVPAYLKNTLNWVAYMGGTDNPYVPNSGDTSSFNPSFSDCKNTSANDPGAKSLSGYIYTTQNISQLTSSLKNVVATQYVKNQSFNSPAITPVRLNEQDVTYISSFDPDEIPFWKGYLRAYQLNSDGTLSLDARGYPLSSKKLWDAYTYDSSSRNIKTYANNSFKNFIYNNLTNADLDVPTDADRANLIIHIRGIDAYDIDMDGNKTEERDWKLGDIMHSNPVIVGAPSQFFEDVGFSDFYNDKKTRTKVIIVGANDGMLHAFDATTGIEKWAFIPNSLLKSLKSMSTTHTYYVDSTPKVADVWLYSSDKDKDKDAYEWKTVLISGLRKGGKHYFALDITDTLNPAYLWEFPKAGDSATLAKVGESWSEPAIGRVKIEIGEKLYERWVAFIGGGFDYTNNTGKAFFVINIKTGNIIKEFSGIADMNYSFASPPTAVDTNGDGFIDKVYIGDLGGQMWVFDVSYDSATSKSDSQWSGKVLFKTPVGASEKHRIYYQPAVALDKNGIPWVYFGTGDRENPKNSTNANERFYAVKDDGGDTYYQESNLEDRTTSNTFNPIQDSKKGWYIKLEKSSGKLEKVLAKPTVFNRIVYFTTYSCSDAITCTFTPGASKIYMVEYLSGGGALAVDDLIDFSGTPTSRSSEIRSASGISTGPVISISLRGHASVTTGTMTTKVLSQGAFSSAMKELLYWREIIP